MFRLTLFGPFSLTDSNEAEVPIASKKAKALLAYLAQTPGRPRSREEVLALLWSNREESQGRASLRQVLTRLRKEVGEDLLHIDRDSVTLNAKQVELNPKNGEEFLAGFSLNDPAFEDWLRDTRLSMEGKEDARSARSQPEDFDRPYIAVLPFANYSGDTEQQYFADGITDDITTELSRFHKFWVISRNSSFVYQAKEHDMQKIGHALGADYLVEGSVRMAGRRVRVAAQLTDVHKGTLVWADRYDREIEEIFTVQDDVVSSVVSRLDLNIDAVARARAKNRPTESLHAYDLLLRARYAWWHGQDAEAFRFTRKSVEADPNSAVVNAYFALQHAYQFYSGALGLTHKVIAEKCQFHAERALDLDDTDPVVHAYASMAFGFSPLASKERGLKHIEIAVSINPHDCEFMVLHAWHLSFAGYHQRALEVLKKMSDLNPLGGYVASECYLDTYYMLGEYRKALDSYKDQAAAPHQSLASFAACYAKLGETDAMADCLAELERRKPVRFDLHRFAEAQIATCVRDADKENWRDGFRRAGVDV